MTTAGKEFDALKPAQKADFLRKHWSRMSDTDLEAARTEWPATCYPHTYYTTLTARRGFDLASFVLREDGTIDFAASFAESCIHDET